ncbi:hypothetical protein AB0O07_29195 [Streptomyces sp. NPDC093085]|uniref:hypothetical protein n=1 Tax=Streptomyces sp. NPDC093085 TaxID=3155068 RepID=UPI0034438695
MREDFGLVEFIYWFLGTAVLISAVVFFVVLARNLFSLRRRGTEITGTCVAEKPTSSVIRYKGPDGKTYERTIGGGKSGRIASLGQEVRLVCDPRRPGNVSRPPVAASEGYVYVVMAVLLSALVIRLLFMPF